MVSGRPGGAKIKDIVEKTPASSSGLTFSASIDRSNLAISMTYELRLAEKLPLTPQKLRQASFSRIQEFYNVSSFDIG